jgi:hypothetical protein
MPAPCDRRALTAASAAGPSVRPRPSSPHAADQDRVTLEAVDAMIASGLVGPDKAWLYLGVRAALLRRLERDAAGCAA